MVVYLSPRASDAFCRPKGRRLPLDNESYFQPLYPRPEPQKWALQASPIVIANTTEQG